MGAEMIAITALKPPPNPPPNILADRVCCDCVILTGEDAFNNIQLPNQ